MASQDDRHEETDGLVLAGGRSTRFGSDKASAPLRGRPLLQWVVAALEVQCRQIVIVKASGQVLPALETTAALTIVEDRYPGKGPLAGLVTGFPHVKSALCFATSCDAPLLRPGLVEYLRRLAEDYDVVCPFVDGFHQPLAALYRAERCLPVFEDNVARDLLRIVPAFEGLRTRLVSEDEVREADPAFDSFRNANRPERLAEVEAILAERERT